MRSQARGHVLRDREAWKADLEERDVARADLPREIARDTKSGASTAVQTYTKIIVVNHCLNLANTV